MSRMKCETFFDGVQFSKCRMIEFEVVDDPISGW